MSALMKAQVKHLSDGTMTRTIDLAKDVGLFPYDLLPLYPQKVVLAKMEQMEERGLLEVGVSLRTAWVIR